ncbi:hypothetical protein [Halorussus caseinilyticus]|uniref:Xylose isomerase-like TIM barrel domain-containing protein n=1 Tax=Halorussus caseinilyticus TaxID=3034025 RepID=A0ABD5WRE9_9EURY
MLDPPIAVSLPPDRLSVAARVPGAVELKFSWDHRDLLVGESDLDARLDASGVEAHRIASVHLPPGTETRGDEVGMALTAANRGTIVDFVHGQLDRLRAATLVAHPPKKSGYDDAIPLLSNLLELTNREISVENTAVESPWHTPEDLGFVASLARRYRPLSDLRLTVDSAHLPAKGRAAVSTRRTSRRFGRDSGRASRPRPATSSPNSTTGRPMRGRRRTPTVRTCRF